ncbi:hypothetical protein; putative exported protein [Xenorhabdus nematophila ATCC 19061]|uniref:Uncharacterized protein n=1 Tax=Xenorhabdus nematophila (strain ATCC 19061 / DSM 3370 / CCUG 14189 / LMG 1036 / NCIMB 9965 / AN6) TaxID=406817 RepID=D3VJB6_XENNA|nr:hypothetical protein; putative exported protein [Xenorhabdus nematophila ATCC 19061]
MLLLASLSLGCGLGFFAIDQIAKIGLSSLQVIYYFENLFSFNQNQTSILYNVQ